MSEQTPPPATSAEPLPSQLSADELAFHQATLNGVQAAQAILQHAQAQARDAEGAYRCWARHLQGKYGLADVDEINFEGRILRKQPKG